MVDIGGAVNAVRLSLWGNQNERNMSNKTGGKMTVHYESLVSMEQRAVDMQYSIFHAATSNVDCDIVPLYNGDSIVHIGPIQYYLGVIGRDEWNFDLPPFVIAFCAHWQAVCNGLPF